MSVEQIEATLLKLPREARRQFADWFYKHENEILDPRDDDEISPEVMAEILRRREEALAHPELLEPWEGTTESLRAQRNEIRRQKAQAR
jgi:hypothetical protein